MPHTNDITSIILPHLSLFEGFCRPATDTRRPDEMRDGSPRNPDRNGTINAMSQAEFDALPAWSDIEDDLEYNNQTRPTHETTRYSAYVDSCTTPLLPRTTATMQTQDDDDAHTRCGFWGESVPKYSSIFTSFPRLREDTPDKCQRKRRKSMWPLFWFWCAVSVGILATTGVAFAMDLGASQYGYGTGVAAYMVHGAPTISSSTTQPREMQFCLVTPDRSAPGSRTWRYIPPNAPTKCSTEVVTLLTREADHGQIHTSDGILFDGEVGARVAESRLRMNEKTRRPVTVEERIRALELGDNIAEEGVLRQMI